MNNRYFLIAVVLGGLLLLPALPFDARNYVLQVSFFLFMNIVLAESYDIVGGYLGYLNLGHICFFAVGAYGFGVLFNLGLGFLPALVLATLMAVAFAALISYPFFRLRGPYFTLATFGLVRLMEYLTINFGTLTGGSNGLKIDPADRTLPVYFAALALVVAVVAASWLVGRS